MRIVCISDTHNQHAKLPIPNGDILIHAGDATCLGELKEVIDFAEWMRSLPHKHKIFVAGNHDWAFQIEPSRALSLMNGITYLQDSEVTINGLRIYGSPWTPEFCGWAFMLERHGELQEKWAAIPFGVDVLITHGPAKGILDQNKSGEECGCYDLAQRIPQVQPLLHVFGHIHDSYGMKELNGTIHVNAALDAWPKMNAPIVVDL